MKPDFFSGQITATHISNSAPMHSTNIINQIWTFN